MKNLLKLGIDYVIGISLFCVIWLYYILITKIGIAIEIVKPFSKWFDWSLNPIIAMPLVVIAVLMLIKTVINKEDLKTNWPIFSNLPIFIAWIISFHGQDPAIWLLMSFSFMTVINGLFNITWVAQQARKQN